MDNQSCKQVFSDVCKALEQQNLLQALFQLQPLVNYCGDWKLQTEWENIRQAYQSLLSYMSQGIEDRQREVFYIQFLQRCYQLAAKTLRETLTGKEDTAYYVYLNTYRNEGISFHSLSHQTEQIRQQMFFSSVTENESQSQALRKKYEESIDTLFSWIVSSFLWTEEEAKEISNMFSSPDFPEEDKALLVSAIMISEQYFFSEQKFLLLIQLYSQKNKQIRLRALVAVLFTILLHPQILQLYPKSILALKDLQLSKRFNNDLSSFQIQLLSIQQTNKVEKTVSEEIIPEIMKSQRFINVNKLGLDEIEELMDDESDIISKQEKETKESLENSVKKLIELHEKGADVYFSQFRAMKFFPFFNKTSNWFRIFSPNFSVLADQGDEARKLVAVMSNVQLCDSDKFSMILLLNKVDNSNASPSSFRQQLSQMLKEQFPVTDEIPDLKTEEQQRLYYLQDCYRFFQLFGHRNEYINPFSKDLLLPNNPIINSLFQPEETERLALYAYQQGELDAAVQLFSKLPQNYSLKMESLLAYGIALESEHNYVDAIHYFTEASLVAPDSVRIYSHLGNCHRKLGQYEEAATAYQRLLILSPENTAAAFHLGESFFQTGQIEEALKHFHKIEFLKPNSIAALRAIAWCLLSLGQVDEAEQYYQKIFSLAPKAADYLNAGHTAWLANRLQDAIQCYRQYMNLSDKKEQLFCFSETDQQLLQEKGISQNNLQFMTDILNDQLSNL